MARISELKVEKIVAPVAIAGVADMPPEPESVTFESYFHVLQLKNEDIKDWHKPAMEAFILQHGGSLLLPATVFAQILESY